ncbi:protein kinase domain-containing protein [Ditylenchus destructor]|uniref:mitogen-activated protein kinase kinase n=1 Tax=Ditylenchus destructor TaxID=166010 RepID=A0AAD4NFP8_9BILA|nr:protein kinase domain-containing protein [Ditylenchus destructor]
MDGRTNLKLDLTKVNRLRAEPKYLEPMPGQLNFPNDPNTYNFSANDLIEEDCIGTGSYGGVVARMVHKNSGNVMAVKRVRAHEIDTTLRRQMLRELTIIIQSQNCEDVVRFYGALFQDGDCWICMELMDYSLDKFYRQAYKRNQRLPEDIVGFISTAVVRALEYLKAKLNIIHRDVKPSNILLDRKGFVKICDFGISGFLVDSIARTQDVGCQIYMAPERLAERTVYGIKSDVWSFGITLVEICIGHFPYTGWNSVFDQLQAVVHGDPPFLQADYYSTDLVNFVNKCLIKETDSRPKFCDLMTDPFFQKHNASDSAQMTEKRKSFGNYLAQFLEE